MTAQAASPGALPRRSRRFGLREETRWAIVFLLPWIIGFVVFTAGPMIASLLISFTRYNGVKPPEFVGAANYDQLAHDPRITQTLFNTAFYTILHVPLSMLLALGLALLLLRVGRAAGFFRTVFYLPALTPAVAVGTLFILMLGGNGLVNQGLELLGIDGPRWLTDPDWIKFAIVLLSLWGIGSTVVIYFAALRNVPVDLYEAARIDGANSWQQFRNITLPFISGALFFTLIVNTISSLQIFAEIYTIWFGAKPAPGAASARMYVVYLFEKAFGELDFGFASAMAWLLFLVILVISVVQVRLSRRFVYYEGEEK